MRITRRCPKCKKYHDVESKICSKCQTPLKGQPYTLDYYFFDENGIRQRKRELVGKRKDFALTAQYKRAIEIEEGKYLDKKRQPPKILFKDLAQEYIKWCELNNKTPFRKILMLKALLPHFGDKHITDISTWYIEKYFHQRKATNRKRAGQSIKPATINREISLLSHMFNKSIEWKLLKDNPMKPIKKLPEKNIRIRFLSIDEIGRLLSECKGYLNDIVTTALHTGMRKGEIFNLMKQDIDFKQENITVSDSKTHESRNIPLNSTLYDTLKPLCDKLDSPENYLFVNPQTNKPLDSIKKSFKTVLKNAGIDNFTFHDLRHTFASHLVMSGVDLNTVRELLGHKDIKMTLRYSHLSPNHKKFAIQRLDNIFTTPESKVISLRSKK